jgi:mRNA-degrading endonuclease RelE of RelBE toxin-antitoxin system
VYALSIDRHARSKEKTSTTRETLSSGYRLQTLCYAGGPYWGLKKLKGSKNEYRLRVGNYRVIFEIEAGTINVFEVDDRKDVYR